MKAINVDEFELSTGKKFYANRLMISIGRDHEAPMGFVFGYGADGDLPLADRNYVDEYDYFTLDEQMEIAKHALKMWQEYINILELKEDYSVANIEKT